MKCETCDGHGYTINRANGFEIEDCDDCSGEGELPDSVSVDSGETPSGGTLQGDGSTTERP